MPSGSEPGGGKAKVVVLGAAGIIGRAITRLLVQEGTYDVLPADARADALGSLSRDLGLPGAVLDVKDAEAALAVLRGADLAVNAASYPVNLEAMEACLRAGCEYLDLGGLYHTTRRQLALDEGFRSAGRAAVLGCGKAPGITNVLAALGARHFDAFTRVHLRSGRRSFEAQALSLPYSPETLLDEFTLPPVVLEGGEIREVAPMAGREVVRHPEPIGAIEYITTLHSELATLPGFLNRGLAEMDFKVSLPSALLEALHQLVRIGFGSREPIEVSGRTVVPRDVAAAALRALPTAVGREAWIVEVEMVGERAGRPVHRFARVTGDEAHNGTAIAAVSGVRLLAKGVVPPGVQAPEAAFPPPEFLRELKDRGLGFEEREASDGGGRPR